jgi:hypothetical protein
MNLHSRGPAAKSLPADLARRVADDASRERIVRLPGDGFAGRGFIRLTEGGFWRGVRYNLGSTGPFASALDASVWVAGGWSFSATEQPDFCIDLAACSARGLEVALAERMDESDRGTKAGASNLTDHQGARVSGAKERESLALYPDRSDSCASEVAS